MENRPATPRERAVDAIVGSSEDPASPYAAANARARRAVGGAFNGVALIDSWQQRHVGSSVGSTRYRWDVSHYRCPVPPYAGPVETWTPWRAAELSIFERDMTDFDSRLAVPIAVSECSEFLDEIASGDFPDGGTGGELVPEATRLNAAHILEEADPVFRRDLAACVLGSHSFRDTFALRCLTMNDRALVRLHPLAVAVAENYVAGLARPDGVVLGARFPFHEKPLVSATAQLAFSLVRLGTHVHRLAAMVQYLRREQRPSGGWGDGGGEEDVLTTWVTADLLASLDPTFDPETARRFLESRQRPDGFFRALGPEMVWLTWRIVEWMDRSREPFSARFDFPRVLSANRDRKTRLPFYAYFDDLAELFSALPGLSSSAVEIAFIDLAGFRAFNNRFGQEFGDRVLTAFAEELGTMKEVAAVRDGGDEFVLIGAPHGAPMDAALDTLRRRWPSRFAARFGKDAPPVAPRILVVRTLGGHLRTARETLGGALGALKQKAPAPEPEGVIERLDAHLA